MKGINRMLETIWMNILFGKKMLAKKLESSKAKKQVNQKSIHSEFKNNG